MMYRSTVHLDGRQTPSGAGKRGEFVLLGLGSNMGNRLRYLRRAVFGLATHPEMRVTALSRVYESEFVGEGAQDPYLNACLALESTLHPQVLLAVLKGLEERLGRPARGHMLPRPIDLDILLFGDRVLRQKNLVVPHPRLTQRAFVLEPLAEIAPSRKIPDSGETIAEACAKIRRKSSDRVVLHQNGQLLPQGSLLADGKKEDWRAALAVHCR